jgi:hypothetical protein
VPKTRQITRWLLTRPDHLQADGQVQLEAVRARCPHIDALAGHVTAFAEMMTARTGSRDLEAWLAGVKADDQSGLRSFAADIRNDMPAVINGLTLHWNSGRVEGTVNKMTKRQMYGRAGFDLLRKRVTSHPALPDHKIPGRANYVIVSPSELGNYKIADNPRQRPCAASAARAPAENGRHRGEPVVLPPEGTGQVVLAMGTRIWQYETGRKVVHRRVPGWRCWRRPAAEPGRPYREVRRAAAK